MKKFSLLTLILLLTCFCFAQDGTIQGSINQKANEKDEAIYAAKVVLLNADNSVIKGVQSDFDGNYKLKTSPGKYKLRVSATGLSEQLLDIEIKENEVQNLNFSLVSPVIDQQEVVVVAKRANTSDVAVTEGIKTDLGVKSSMGAEQIASTGSSDTKEVLSKMSGVSSSASTGGVIFVRGLGDRYNSAYLNGLPLVSPNPELKVMPMDIMPTSIIDVLDISKMMTPNVYGDFAGGVINIRTKKMFRTPKINVSIGSNSNSQITGRSFVAAQGGKTDFFGFDDGTRALPTKVKQVSMERADNVYQNGLYNSNDAQIGTGFKNNFNPVFKTAMPGANFKIEGGNYFKSNNANHPDRGIGFLTMLSHSTSYKKTTGTSRYINAQNKLEYNFDIQSDVFSTSTVGLASIIADFSKNSSLHFNYLFINNTDDQTAQSWGYHRDYNDDGKNLYGRRNTYSQNLLNVYQLIGKQNLRDERVKINYGTSFSTTSNVVPDRKQITALYDDKNETEKYNLLALDANHTHRFFSNLNEKEIAAHGDLNWNLFSNKSADTTTSNLDFIVGFDFKQKSREFNFRQFNYLAKPLADKYANNFNILRPDDYLNDRNLAEGLFKIEESANPGNGYLAEQQIIGTNVGFNYQVSRKLELIPNLRVEDGFQSVISRKQTQANVKEVNIIQGIDLMPSLAMKYALTPNQLLRFGASRTIIRPKFFEVAPFEYLAQVVGLTQIGNPNLKNASNINLDLRYEIYTPKSADLLIFGVFGKRLTNPIEQIQRPAASGQIISFDNTKSGTVAGGEIEYAKNLSFLVGEGKRKESSLKNYSIAGNIAYIYSKIDVNDTTGFTTNAIRPLQGASPFLANLTLKYENKFDRNSETNSKKWMKLMSAVSFSYASKTLYTVGVQGIGDQYIFPTYQLNWTNKMTFSNNFTFAFTLRNILNNKYQIMQQDMVNKNQWQEVNTFKRGVDFQFSLMYTFNYKKNKHTELD